MGGRGTFAIGNTPEHLLYKTVAKIEGVKVLDGILEINGVKVKNPKHNLPEESKSSGAYIKLNKDGSFRMMRFYNASHEAAWEIAYHAERNIDKSGKAVLHYHFYGQNFHRGDAIKATKAMKKRYKKFLRGILL